METPSRHTYDLDGSQRVFPVPSPIKGDNYCRIEVDGIVINDRAKYDIVNNSIVFIDVADVPDGSQLDVLVVQSEEAIGQLAIATNIDLVAQSIDNVNAVGEDLANVGIVSGSIGNVNEVGSNIVNVLAVAANETNINSLVANETNVNLVAGNIANVNTVATDITNVNTVATNIVDVNSVAANTANINAVAANEADIDSVAANEADIDTVAANMNSVINVSDHINDVINDANPNILDNGDFPVAQRGRTFTNATAFTSLDGNYIADRWKGLNSLGTSTAVFYNILAKEDYPTFMPDDARGCVQMEPQTTCQLGWCEYIPYSKAKALQGQTVSFSFGMYTNNTSVALRAGVFSWTGTADSLPSDPITAWQTGNLTCHASFTLENTPSDFTVTTPSTWERKTIDGSVLDTANINNLMLLVWTPQTVISTDRVRVTKFKLEEGSVATAWKPKSYTDELIVAQSFFQKTIPGLPGFYRLDATSTQRVNYIYPTTMAKTPQLTITQTSGTATIAVVGNDAGGHRLSFVGTSGELQSWDFVATREL